METVHIVKIGEMMQHNQITELSNSNARSRDLIQTVSYAYHYYRFLEFVLDD